MSAKVDVAAGSKTQLLVDKINVVWSALGSHLHPALTTSTLCNNYYFHPTMSNQNKD